MASSGIVTVQSLRPTVYLRGKGRGVQVVLGANDEVPTGREVRRQPAVLLGAHQSTLHQGYNGQPTQVSDGLSTRIARPGDLEPDPIRDPGVHNVGPMSCPVGPIQTVDALPSRIGLQIHDGLAWPAATQRRAQEEYATRPTETSWET